MNSFTELPPQPQSPFADPPYDKWAEPDGEVAATFHRVPGGFVIRFPDQADFAIDAASMAVRTTPVDSDSIAAARTLFHNSIAPMLGNYRGELNLHGSAVAIGDTAIGFLGVSRRGKTTLAGACARAGHPFLTEDVLALEPAGDGYTIRPSRPELRLFHDSAAFLLGSEPGWDEEAGKNKVYASPALPFLDENVNLGGLFILGPGTSAEVSVARLGQAEALTSLMQHCFILDVEDRQRLKGHFLRIAQLAQMVPCYNLDYPRSYDQLTKVIDALVNITGKRQVNT